MKTITFYDPDTGEIKFSYQGENWIANAENHPGLNYIDGDYESTRHYIDGGVAVNMPEKPSDFHRFNWQTKTWNAPPDYLDRVKAVATNKVNTIAGDIILKQLPDWKQRNMIARMVEIQSDNGVNGQEWNRIKQSWNWVKQVRNASDAAVLAIESATTEDDINQAHQAFIDAVANFHYPA